MSKLKTFIVRTIVFSISMSIFAGAGAYVLLSKKQTYTASTNIKFVNAAASDGYTYNGALIKDAIGDITGSEVLDAAIQDEYMQDVTTSNKVAKMISVSEVIPEDEQDKIDSALKNGKEYTYNPVEYTITINTDLPQAGKLLNSIVRNYISYYSENYVSSDGFPSNIKDLITEDTNYDYIEEADLIRSNIEQMESFLSTKAGSYSEYHCSANGYSFSDIYNKYEYVYNSKLPELYAKILANKASKNPDLLLKKLEQQNSSYSTKSEDTNEELEKLESMIKSYSEKNKSSGTVTSGTFGDNYDENHTSIISGVYENNYNPESTYDGLFSTYISELDLISTNGTSISYNEYLADVFSEAEALSDANLKVEIEDIITGILTDLDELYGYASEARLEHLDIESTSMIVQVNTPISVKQLSVKMYALLAMIGTFLFTIVAVPVIKIFIQNIKNFVKTKKMLSE